MSEIGKNSEASQELSRIQELLHPRNNPEVAFQSYGEFLSDSVGQKKPFLDGETRNPILTYAKQLNLSDMDKGIIRLAELADSIENVVDGEAFETIRSSLEYRMDEMHFVKVMARFREVAQRGDADAVRELAVEAKELSESLYGKPDPEVRDGALNMIWGNVDNKNFSGKAAQLRDDLVHGFVSAEGFSVSPMRRADNLDARLPDFDEYMPAIRWTEEHYRTNNDDIKQIVDNFWNDKVAENGEDYVCGPDDIVEAFGQVIASRDPEGLSGVGVVLKEGATALSWETPLMAVQVGSKRKPIESPRALFASIAHEFGHHGQKAINGFKTGLPSLGAGLFTGGDSRSEYLTFEEGFATIVEQAIKGDKLEWSSANFNNYLAVSFASEGDDFRTVFEKVWRYNLLYKANEGDSISDEEIQKARSSAYGSCIRVFRGAPMQGQEAGGQSFYVTFNKDLAYLNGRIKVLPFLRQAYQLSDESILDRAYMGKYDPTDPVQANIASRYIE